VGIRGCLGCTHCQKRLKLSLKVDECKPLEPGGGPRRTSGETHTQRAAGRAGDAGRGLHSLTSEINLRTFGTHRSRWSSP